MMLKIAVLAPMPSVSVNTAAIVKPGFFLRALAAWVKSRQNDMDAFSNLYDGRVSSARVINLCRNDPLTSSSLMGSRIGNLHPRWRNCVGHLDSQPWQLG